MAKVHFRVKEFGPSSDKVVFFFTALNTQIWLYKLLIRRLIKNGYHVVTYDYSGRLVLGGKVGRFIEAGQDIEADVRGRIAQFQAAGVQTFHCIGVSMGTLFAIICTANIAAIKKVVINLTYGSVAENVWTWWYLADSKKKIIKQGMDMHALDRALMYVSPIPNARKLKGKKVLLYLARRDRVLLHVQSTKFKEALEQAGVELEYHENKWLGHVAAATKNFWRWRTYIHFLARDA